MNSNGKHDRPWYIHDQRWGVLTAAQHRRDLLKYINPEMMRPGRQSDTAELREEESKWQIIDDRDAVVFNTGHLRDEEGNPIDFRLLAITSDAGMGKSDATEWIQYRLNVRESPAGDKDPQSGSRRSRVPRPLSFHFEIRQFVSNYNPRKVSLLDDLMTALADKWLPACQAKIQPADPDELRLRLKLHIRSLMRRGEICLIFDGLDQVGDSEVDVLTWILDLEEFKTCRFIVAGRPNAIVSKWDRLFAKHRFAYVQVYDFTRPQQVRYLGWLPDGKPRFKAIDRDAWPILYVPRVLSYLRKQNDFTGIRTAADVYDFAIDKMLYGALERLTGETPDDDQIRSLTGLLCITAFETMRLFHGDKSSFQRSADDPLKLTAVPSGPEQEPPDYEYNLTIQDIREEGGFEDLKTTIKQSYKTLQLSGDADEQWNLLGRLNTILDQGIFDDQRGGLNQVVWSNRSLHEYLLAGYYAAYAEKSQCDRLWDWIYIAGVPKSDKYYQFWQFLSELPGRARNPMQWLNAIEIIFWPSVTDHKPGDSSDSDESDSVNSRLPRIAKRSTEMIYRAWPTLETYCNSRKTGPGSRANGIRDRWRGEFETDFLGTGSDPELRKIAEAIKDHFMLIPEGPVTMGTSDEKQRPQHWIDGARQQFDSWSENPDQIRSWLTEDLGYNLALRSDQRSADRFEAELRQAVTDGDFEAFLKAKTIGNESRVDRDPISSFLLGRHPVLNRYYRLFQPEHGISLKSERYCDYSKTEFHPAVRLSFFDSFVFSRWLCWDGLSCSLPYEDQWERAAKLETGDWTQSYWWGDDFDPQRDRQRINCRETNYGTTLPPSPDRASPASRRIDAEADGTGEGLMDMLGGCWEWCQDVYRHRYGHDPENPERTPEQLQERDISGQPGFSRSLRGGSFSGSAASRDALFGITMIQALRLATAVVVLPGLENLDPFPFCQQGSAGLRTKFAREIYYLSRSAVFCFSNCFNSSKKG